MRRPKHVGAQRNLEFSASRQNKRDPTLGYMDGLDPTSVEDDMRVRPLINPMPMLAKTRQQTRLGRGDERSFLDQRQAGFSPVFGREIGVRLHEFSSVGEGGSVSCVEIGLCRQPFGEKHVMGVELDVPIFDVVLFHLDDRVSVDKGLDRHQRALGRDIVSGAEPEIAVWKVRNSKRMG